MQRNERSKPVTGKIGNDNVFGFAKLDLTQRVFFCELRNSNTLEYYFTRIEFSDLQLRIHEQMFEILGRSNNKFTLNSAVNGLLVEDSDYPLFQLVVPSGSLNAEDRLSTLMKLQQKEIEHNKIWTYSPPNITFNQHVTVGTHNQWTIVPKYSIQVDFPKNFSAVQISLNIPFCGNWINGASPRRYRVQLLFDDVPICECAGYSNQTSDCATFLLQGLVQNVTSGLHRIEVRVLIDQGTMNIPNYNPDALEGIAPAMFAKYSFIGYP